MLRAGSLPHQLSPILASASDRPSAVLPLAVVERQALLRALETTENNVKEAAEVLGISRSTLHRKLKKYDLDRD